jgi:UDP-2,4-diacetamido-2,4,6-trideoxy-beta-L-altropyranose hydrolase
MDQLRIVFRTDANQQIGTGHFMRCLTLADEIRRSTADIWFVARELPMYLQQMLIEHGVRYLALPKPDTTTQSIDELAHASWLQTSQAIDAEQTLAALGEGSWNWLVVDHYALDHRYEKLLRKVCKHVMVIDDLADRVHDCDVLLDQNYYQDQDQRYLGKVPSHCRMLLGAKFALLRPEFKAMREKVKARTGKVKNILVFFGGVDADNLTGQVLEVIINLKLDVHVDVVIGQQHPQKETIQKLCTQHNYTCHVQTNRMADLMAQADLAIGAGGTTVWERFCLGLPSVCFAVASNQVHQLQDLQLAGLLFSPIYYEDPITFLFSYLKNLGTGFKLLHEQSERVMKLVDGRGASKVATVLRAKSLHVRLAEAQDASAIFQWRNHQLIKDHSGNNQEISWDEHRQWFEQRLKNGDPILIGELDEDPVGVVRFDISNHQATVSVYLVPESGFNGWGGALLIQSESWLRKHHPRVATLHAQVLPNNEPSKKLFAKLNYTLTANQPKFEFVKNVEACL